MAELVGASPSASRYTPTKRPMRALLRAAVFVIALPTLAASQAVVDLTSLYVGYMSRKTQANPQGELKARLDSLDREAMAAARAGRTSQARRLLAKASTLLAGRPWTDSLDFATSLRLRTDRVIVDQQVPWTVRLEQTYAPTLDLMRSLTAPAVLRQRPVVTGGVQRMGDVVKDAGVFEGVSRDLMDAPFALDLD